MNGLRTELTEWVSSKSISSSGFMPKPADLQQSSNTVFISAENFDPLVTLQIINSSNKISRFFAFVKSFRYRSSINIYYIWTMSPATALCTTWNCDSRIIAREKISLIWETIKRNSKYAQHWVWKHRIGSNISYNRKWWKYWRKRRKLFITKFVSDSVGCWSKLS